MDPPSTRKPCEGGKRPSSRRIPSFSSSTSSGSSSSSSSSSVDDSFVGPATPLRLISRIPFSWEHFPGIPKNTTNNNNTIIASSSPSHKLILPLPPPTTTTTRLQHHPIRGTRKKNFIQGTFHQRDPFFAAFVECSKSNNNHHDPHQDHEGASTSTSNSNTSLWNSNHVVDKVSRSLSDRFELISLFASCKRTCAVSESMVHLPSSRRTS